MVGCYCSSQSRLAGAPGKRESEDFREIFQKHDDFRGWLEGERSGRVQSWKYACAGSWSHSDRLPRKIGPQPRAKISPAGPVAMSSYWTWSTESTVCQADCAGRFPAVSAKPASETMETRTHFVFIIRTGDAWVWGWEILAAELDRRRRVGPVDAEFLILSDLSGLIPTAPTDRSIRRRGFVRRRRRRRCRKGR